ncbi:DUF2637 domain-containing protein [Streptomyces sp. A0642]|uniref:DUF2637 domain-containing protein n=1 Tax=Streptomyces sp. A0642 TaxID=2563100 RepID=UPI0014470F34|nr:DUF2637 domain-containing protein [Streptomyces sp. A0642]
MSSVAHTQGTRPARLVSAPPTWRTKLSTVNWDKTLTDTMIYLLALGGFYVGYQTLYTLALYVDFPQDQAVVVAALADLAILAYSRKAVQEVNAGRSAWGIRAIVTTFSLGTFALQIRAAWPDPVAVGFHALPPAVWIIGHEMMLRGKLRNAKKMRRDHEIIQGLRPAPLPAIRKIHWILSPFRTFQAWRLTKLWEVSQDTVIKQLASAWQNDSKKKNKPLPAAWRRVLIATPAPAATLDRITITATPTFKAQPQPQPKAIITPTPAAPAPRLQLLTGGKTNASPAAQAAFLADLPAPPPKGSRTGDDIADYVTIVDQLSQKHGITLTEKAVAQLADCDTGQLSRLRAKARAPKPQQLTAVPAVTAARP